MKKYLSSDPFESAKRNAKWRNPIDARWWFSNCKWAKTVRYGRRRNEFPGLMSQWFEYRRGTL